MTWRACTSQLVGRKAELAFLERLRAEVVRSSSGRMALVAGEAGVGKSRLLRELSGRAVEAGSTVLTGRSIPGGDAYRALAEAVAGALRGRGVPDDPALRPYLPALGCLLPELSDGEAVNGGRIVLGEAVLRLMAALSGSGGTVLVLEDVQWADPDTLDILMYLAHAANAVPLLLLLTARDEPDTPRQIHDLLASCSLPLVSLQPLSPAEVGQVVASCLRGRAPDELVAFVVEHADGLPFLAEELLSGLAAVGALDRDGRLTGPLTPNVPRTFAATVRRRLEALTPSARRVVEAAAVLGRRFDWRLLPEMTGVAEPEVLTGLRAVVTTGLVESSGADTFRFRHALTRDAVSAELLPPDVLVLARAGAAAVEQREPGAYEAAAGLWAAAGEPARAAGLYLQAGQQARRRAALQTADLLLSRAARLAEPGSAAQRQAEHALLEVLAATGNADRALALGEGLLGAGETSVRLTLAEIAAEAGRPDLAAKQLDDIAEDTPRAQVLEARIAYDLGDPEAARARAEKTLLSAREAELWSVACEALQVLGRAARLTDLTEARQRFAEAEALARDHDLPVERIDALHELGTIDLLVDGGIDLLLQTRALAVAAGLLALTATVDVQIAASLLHREPDDAMQHAERSARMAQGLQMDRLRATALFFCAAVHAHRRAPEAMERCIAEAMAAAPDDLDVNAGIWGAARAHVALLADDLDELAFCLDTAVTYLRRSASTTPAPTRGLWALVRTLQDREGEAARTEAAPSMVNWENRSLLGYAEAVVAGRQGDRTRAERLFAMADAAMARLPWWQHRIRLLIAGEAAVAHWGAPVTWANEAREVFTARGDDLLAARCRQVYSQAGVPIPRARGTTRVPAYLAGYGLTSREMDVLTLAGEGLSDAQIAARFQISPRTVESHIGSLRTKTGTRNRTALIELFKSGERAR